MFGWRRRLPARLRPPLERDERILAWAQPEVPAGSAVPATSSGPSHSAGSAAADENAVGQATPADVTGDPGAPVLAAPVLAATNRGLWLSESPPRRLGWADIHKAAWSGRELVITPASTVTTIGEYVVMADERPLRYVLSDPGDLPHHVRARVTRSVAYTVHHPLPGGGGVRVVARRVPGLDGLRWTVRYDNGADLDDPLIREMTSQLVAQARTAANV